MKISKNKVYRIGMVLNKASTMLPMFCEPHNSNLQAPILYASNIPPLIVQILRLVGIQWVFAHVESTLKAPFSLSALANQMIRSGMVSSGVQTNNQTNNQTNKLNKLPNDTLRDGLIRWTNKQTNKQPTKQPNK